MSNTTIFNLRHNLAEYDQLVTEKYADNPAVEQKSSPFQDAPFQSFQPYQQHQQPAPQPILDGYYDCGNTYTQKTAGFSPAVTLDQYTQTPSPARTRPATYRPKIYDPQLHEVDYVNAGLPQHNSGEDTRLVLEVNVDDAVPVIAKDAARDTEEMTSFKPAFKLNGIGMIAVVSFIAVTIMVIAFIIVNSVAISGASARIATLQAQNQEMSQEVSQLQASNNEIILDQQNIAQGLVNDGVLGPITSGTLTAPAWQVPPQAGSNNLFDAICKFFNKIFGRLLRD